MAGEGCRLAAAAGRGGPLRIDDDSRDAECEATSPRGAHYLEACCTPC